MSDSSAVGAEPVELVTNGRRTFARGVCWRCKADLSKVCAANPWLCLDCYAGKPETPKSGKRRKNP